MIKLVLFDFDGVIADSTSLILDLFTEFCGIKGLEILSHSDLKKITMNDRFDMVENHKEEYFDWYPPKFYAGLLEVELCSGIREALIDLNESLALSVVSSSKTKDVQEFLDRHNLNLFDNVVGDAGLNSKEEVINNVLEEWGFSKDEAIYVGDESRDIIACRKAGIKIICSSWGIEHPDSLQTLEPEFLASNPEEIISILNSLNS